MKLTQTHIWAGMGLVARIAPVSLVPLLLHFYGHSQVDWFVLVQANATIIAVILGLAQSNFIQQQYSEEKISAIIALASAVPPTLFSIMYVLLDLTIGVDKTLLVSGVLGLAMSYVPQAQAILRCTNNYGKAIAGDAARVSLYSAFAVWIVLSENAPIEFAVFIMAFFYILPYLIFFLTEFQKLSFGPVLNVWWKSLPYFATVTCSVFISATTLSLLRYIILNFGQDGDLALYSAIYSVASLSVVTVDFIYVRFGQDIVAGARDRNDKAVWAVAKRIALPIVAISAVSLIVTVLYAAILAPRVDGGAVIAAAIIVASFTLRSIYIFFQNILIGLRSARFDFIASGLALATTAIAGPVLVTWWPIVGAALVFLLVCLTYVITLGNIVRIMRRPP
jgi:O-antigen/teichoic acid export membrane protein